MSEAIDPRTIVANTLVPHTAFHVARKQLEKVFRNSNRTGDALCLAIIGESRTGKSRALEELFTAHPAKRDDPGRDTPILQVQLPSEPSIKGLAELMLQQLGDPIFNKGTKTGMTSRLKKMIKAANTRVILIDEFQHFYDVSTQAALKRTANWLKGVADESKAALVVAGLPTCTAVIDGNEQLAGRFLAPVRMPRFDWNNAEHRKEFIGILHAFQEALSKHFSIPKFASKEMSFRFYCATGGLMGYLTKILRMAVINAVEDKTKLITLEDLRIAHEEAVWSKVNTSGIISPFAQSFTTLPTTELLAKIALVGTAAPIVSARTYRKRRNAA